VRPEPFRIEPTFVPRIWGARSLAPLYPEKSNLPEPIGEAWLTGVDCKVASGPFAGKPLGEAWREMPPEWRGTRFTEPGDFPILIKFIFPNDKLSIQVHPDDAYAAAHELAAGGRGKTEMWNVVSAEAGAKVLLGLKPGSSREKFLKAFQEDTLEDLLVVNPVYIGDTFYVPAGVPHTIGAGMVLCEVQEYSDLTYRVYDYGRTDAKGKPRELHVQKALDVMQFGKTVGGKVLPLNLFSEGGKRTLLSACRYFATERWEFYGVCTTFQSKRSEFDILVALHGEGRIEWNNGSIHFQSGECWLVPALLRPFWSKTTRHAVLLRAYLPDIALLRAELRGNGHSEAAVVGTVFD
jgi:mannose-6-phosphate isomerase